ncbi:MAG: allophanate hydrolase [Acidimicrobiia bacterium]|nr:allophanate hydrolase [Acidimicrobiia bacterium]
MRAAVEEGLPPAAVVDAVLARIDADWERNAWITVADPDVLHARAVELASLPPDRRGPLHTVPVAVKDNIDVAGLPTTAGCPAYAYFPSDDAPVVARLLAAGAIVVGKTNLDQFATGLVGVRSPYGACHSVLDERLVAGGSSSGSAVAVAAGHVPVALGTDTAGSGRVPAQANGLVGLKPTKGLVPLRGVVPACWSLDCVSVFAADVDGATAVLDVVAGLDPLDRFSRSVSSLAVPEEGSWRIGVAAPLGAPFDSDDWAIVDEAARRLASALGAAGEPTVVPLDDFTAAGDLLYGGAWLAERYASVGTFIDDHPDEVHPVVAELIGGARDLRATQVFADQHLLAELRRRTASVWDHIDVLVTPTAPSLPTVDAVLADPIAENARLGAATTFVNLLDLAALSLPAGRRPDGRPAGVSLVAPAGADALLAAAARAGGW